MSGIYTDGCSDFRSAYPRNMIPVPKGNGISNGYLRPAFGIDEFCRSSGVDRGGINWKGECYRVIANKFVKVTDKGRIIEIGQVSLEGIQAKFDYSFTRLAIVSGGRVYYYDGISFVQVSDPDLGKVHDVLFIDGYFLFCDDQYIIVTELSNPLSINPLKYGSAEVDPDVINCITKVRNELQVVGRYSIEAFTNIGGDLFPFQRIPGAYVARGAVGRRAAVFFNEMIAFVGGGRNEPIAVWMALNGQSQKISTREIDQILHEYNESELFNCVVEKMVDNSHQFLFIQLKDKTLVYDLNASLVVSEPIWFTLDSGLHTPLKYRAMGFVWCYNRWIFGDPTTNKLGTFNQSHSNHYGREVGWDFHTAILYNGGKGILIHEIELVALPGRVDFKKDPVIWTSYSLDGVTWSQETPKKIGQSGERNKRITWFKQGHMRNWRIQKFRGNSDSFLSFARLEINVESLYV